MPGSGTYCPARLGIDTRFDPQLLGDLREVSRLNLACFSGFHSATVLLFLLG